MAEQALLYKGTTRYESRHHDKMEYPTYSNLRPSLKFLVEESLYVHLFTFHLQICVWPGCVVCFLGDTPKSSRHSPVQLAVGGFA